MNLKPTLLAVGLAVACGGLAIAPAALAAPDGTVTINGKVLNATCSVSGSGSPATTVVTLPDVQQSVLTTAGVGAYTASQQPFSITLSGCPTNPAGVQVGLQFYSGGDTVTNNGTLLSTGSAAGVEVQLLDSAKAAVTIGAAAPTGNSNVTDPTTLSSATATLNYFAQYYVTNTTPAAGNVASQTSFVVNYQ